MSSSAHAQLSSLAASVDDVVARLSELAESLDTGSPSDAANALFEAERSLLMARRAIDRGRSALPG